MKWFFDGWIYKNMEFTEEMIPDGAVGFIYEMTADIVVKPKN